MGEACAISGSTMMPEILFVMEPLKKAQQYFKLDNGSVIKEGAILPIFAQKLVKVGVTQASFYEKLVKVETT